MFAAIVCTFGPLLRDALLWLPSWLVIVVVNLWLTWRARPLGRWRWLVAACILSAPVYFPPAGGPACSYLRVLDTLITSLAITSAARLADYDHALLQRDLERWRLYAWLSLPVVGLRAPPARPTSRLRQALRHWSKAAIKRLGWELCALVATYWSTAGTFPWPVRSAFTMLYFVLNLTAFHDLMLGLCVACGLSGDELFDAPLLSCSPRDFWSRRWNKFISRFALKYVALKWGARDRVIFTLLLVFGCSGLFHEYFAWGVGGLSRAPGAMMSFFLVQALAVWVGSRLPWQAPAWVTQPLTFIWMGLTAPLFFMEVAPALLAFGYPKAWLPFEAGMLWGWVQGLAQP